MEIYQFNTYKAYLAHMIVQNRSLRGYQTRLAKAAGCQASYFSGVLNSSLHLTLDQAIGLTQFWNLDFNETEYFINLISRDKSNSIQLKTHLTRKLDAIREMAGFEISAPLLTVAVSEVKP